MTFFTKVKKVLRSKFSATLVVGFIVLLVVCAFLLLLNEQEVAEIFAKTAYLLLAAVVVFQIGSSIFRRE